MISGTMAGNHEIVVVDDDASMCQAIGRLLLTAGWRIITFPSAEAFIDSVSYGRSDLLILDMELPGISGLELKQRMASAGIEMPVIFITGHDHPFLRNQAESAGAIAYFTKPFQGDQMIAAVRRNLSAA
jgi:FixJ family two-component response regulator